MRSLLKSVLLLAEAISNCDSRLVSAITNYKGILFHSFFDMTIQRPRGTRDFLPEEAEKGPGQEGHAGCIRALGIPGGSHPYI